MPLRTSKTEHEYPFGCQRKVGDRFDVEPEQVDVMLRLGRIEPEPGEAGYVEPKSLTTGQPNDYQTRDMAAAKRTKKAA